MRYLVAVIALLGILILASAWIAYKALDRTPGELMRYAERRLIGHPKLEAVIHPIFNFLRPYIERPVTGPIPTLGKGQQSRNLPPQRYTVEGRPTPLDPANVASPNDSSGVNIQIITSMDQLASALPKAQPGDILEMAPGTYKMTRSLRIHNGGLPEKPIVVRANQPGSVTIESTAEEGFHLHAPWWVFENLTIRGICKVHSNCEHAFHIVGKARDIVIRNNRLEDFNAQIKVNGLNNDWPDDGLVQYNTLTNEGKRDTENSVTPIDVVGADRWVVADNLISNFVKGDGNQISYGAFLKGGGSDGQIERNLVICSTKDISKTGNRIGLSLGGGGTDKRLCRDERCITEHSKGTIADNIVAHCNDFGIYINSANQSIVRNNTLANTYGIDVRFPAASAIVKNNSLDGRIRTREKATIEESDNHRHWVVHLPDSN